MEESRNATHLAVLEDTRDFAALEDEWEALYQDSPLATPFQSWAWLYSWWEIYGEDYELRLVTVRDGDLLVGLIPLMLERRWGFFGRLLFIGNGPTDYLDILAKEGWEAQVAKAGVKALQQMGSWQVAELQELRPQAAAWSIFREWLGPRSHISQSNCLIIDVRPWDKILVSLSRNLRSDVRRHLRRAEVDGVRRRLVGMEDVEQAARRLVALSRERLREQETDPKRWSRRFDAYLEIAARRMTARGLGAISEFRRDEEAMISNFSIFGQESVHLYIIGASREALARYQFSSLAIFDAINVAHDRNNHYLDLGRGGQPVKLQWKPRIVSNHCVILGRNLLFSGPYLACQLLRHKARKYVHSESAPRWVKDAVKRYRVLRRRGRSPFVRPSRKL